MDRIRACTHYGRYISGYGVVCGIRHSHACVGPAVGVIEESCHESSLHDLVIVEADSAKLFELLFVEFLWASRYEVSVIAKRSLLIVQFGFAVIVDQLVHPDGSADHCSSNTKLIILSFLFAISDKYARFFFENRRKRRTFANISTAFFSVKRKAIRTAMSSYCFEDSAICLMACYIALGVTHMIYMSMLLLISILISSLATDDIPSSRALMMTSWLFVLVWSCTKVLLSPMRCCR